MLNSHSHSRYIGCEGNPSCRCGEIQSRQPEELSTRRRGQSTIKPHSSYKVIPNGGRSWEGRKNYALPFLYKQCIRRSSSDRFLIPWGVPGIDIIACYCTTSQINRSFGIRCFSNSGPRVEILKRSGTCYSDPGVGHIEFI